MSEKIEYNVRLQGSDGKDYIISYEGLKQKLGLCETDSSIRSIRREVNRFQEAFIENTLVPKMEDKIVTIIKENPEIQTRNLNRKMPSKSMEQIAWYQAFNKLKDERRIIGTSHGRGQNRTWHLNPK